MPNRILLFFVALFSLGFIILARNNILTYAADANAAKFDNLPILTVKHLHRLLIISPHPDDETLAAGGVIQQALAAGSQVKVVIVTNGDGQKFAPALISRKIAPHPRDYIVIGERRQAESRAALHILGLTQYADIVFLGFPDRGTNPIWLADWNTQCPYTASYTRVKKNPYPDTYQANNAYCGNDLLKDLQTIIEGYKPDLIIVPHPADQHPDHGAVSNFARLAIAMTMVKDKTYAPVVWGYLVHYGMFPQPRGKYFGQVLMPPERLMGKNNGWGRVELNLSQVALKYSAIEAYSSQNLLLGEFLPSFARRNELFESLPVQVLPPIAFTTLPTFIHGEKNLSTDFSGVSNEGFPVKGNLMIGWQTARLSDKIWLDLQMKRDMFPDVDCILSVKLPDGRTYRMDLEPMGSIFSSRDFVTQVNLADFGNPSVIAFAAEIKQGGFPVTKTGWHILVLK
jgi:LmbE family N-acetylglucosaminyl deacetylase